VKTAERRQPLQVDAEGLAPRSLSTFYTRLETAKLVAIDPAKYLRGAALADCRGEVLCSADMKHPKSYTRSPKICSLTPARLAATSSRRSEPTANMMKVAMCLGSQLAW
jgi:hypothetical protein